MSAVYRKTGVSSLETEKQWFVPGAHTVLWNAMIHPLLNMTIYGVIWYQGETLRHCNREFSIQITGLHTISTF